MQAIVNPSPLHSRFELQERLGEGAFGITFKAFDKQLSSPVAIKFMKAPLLRQENLESFLKEANRLALYPG